MRTRASARRSTHSRESTEEETRTGTTQVQGTAVVARDSHVCSRNTALWELDVYSSRLLDLQTFLSTTVQNERLRTTSTPTQCQRVAEHLLRDLTERINQDA